MVSTDHHSTKGKLMDLLTPVTISLGFMLTAFWTPLITAIQDRRSLKKHINIQVDRKIELASNSLADSNEIVDLSLNRIISRFRSENSGGDLDAANQTWRLLLLVKYDVAYSVADFAVFEEIYRNNPDATASEKQKVEGYLGSLVEIYVDHLNMERDEAIDIIREEVFFAFSQLDLDGRITSGSTMVNLAESFLQKANPLEDTANKLT
jgi:hypothetical protein